MAIEQNQKILANDVITLIERINTEIARRNACGNSEFWDETSSMSSEYGDQMYSNTTRPWGSNNQITSSSNSHIHASWLCKNTRYSYKNSQGNSTTRYCFYVNNSNTVVALTTGTTYPEGTQFKIGGRANATTWTDTTPENLQRYGCLQPTYTIDTPSISAGAQATAEDINTLIELLNTINTDSYWNTSTAVTVGNLIQSIIEISNTLTKLDESHTDNIISFSQISTNKKNGIGSPPGNTSGCGSACKGLCQSCLGSATSNGSSSGDDGCESGSSGDDCATTCQWGEGGCPQGCSAGCSVSAS